MREIRFKAWNGKAMEYGGFAIHASGSITNILEGLSQVTEQSPIMQFTGLTDKNGKDIYEGDIVRGPFRNGLSRKDIKEKCFDVEVFITPEAGADIKFPPAAFVGDYRWIPHLSECEVIGNIYENPELLECERESIEA